MYLKLAGRLQSCLTLGFVHVNDRRVPCIAVSCVPGTSCRPWHMLSIPLRSLCAYQCRLLFSRRPQQCFQNLPD